MTKGTQKSKPSSASPPPPSDTGLAVLVDDWGSAQAHAGLVGPSSMWPSSSSFDTADAEQWSTGVAFLDEFFGDVEGAADAGLHAPTALPLAPPLPPHALLPRRVEVTVKLHGFTPASLPACLATAFEAWFETAPLLLEGHVRPGCTLLTVDVLLEAHAADAACTPGAEAAMAAHLRAGGAERDPSVAALFGATSSWSLQLRDSAGATCRAALLDEGGAALSAFGNATPVHCRLHGQSLAFSVQPSGGALRLPPLALPGLALFTLPTGAALPVLLCAEPRIVAEVNADRSADGGSACELLGYALRPDATRAVLDAATDVALRRGWLAAAATLLRATQLTQLATPASSASAWNPLHLRPAPAPAWTPLHSACAAGDPRGVALVLSLCSGAAVTHRDKRGLSPLHLAAAHRDARAARLLLASAWPAAPALRAWFGAASHSGDTPSALAVRAGGLAFQLDADLRACCAAGTLTNSAHRAWVVDTNAHLVAALAALQLLRSCFTCFDAVSVLRAPSLAAATAGMGRIRTSALTTSKVYDVVTGARLASEDIPWAAAQSMAAAVVATFPLRCCANVGLIVATTTPRLRGWVQRHWSLVYLVCTILENGMRVLTEYIGLYRPHGLAVSYSLFFGLEHIFASLMLSGILVRRQTAGAGDARANALLVIFRLLASASCLPLSRATWAAAASSPHLTLQAGVAVVALATLPWNDRRLRRLAAVEGARRRRQVRAKQA